MCEILRLFIFGIFVVFLSQVTGIPTSVVERDQLFSLQIVHTNDMHSRFEETSALSTKCTPKESAANECYGGFARLSTLIREARKSLTPTIFLNAGDTYQGTVWYNVHKWKIVARFLNLLSPDAISLGNHEFDDDVPGLLPFLEESKFPIVTCNLNLTNEPELAKSKLLKSTILTINGTKIGIIGYLTPDTKLIASTRKVIFIDEIKAIRNEVEILRNKGVKILIALGHSGFEMDKKIAQQVDYIDIVIGGHTNTFLYTGKRPDIEIPESLYPTEIVQKNGRKVYVVQAYAYTKYLGNLTIDFDQYGEVTKIFGNPILVDHTVEQAKDILEELDKWRPEIDAIALAEIGTTKVLLDGDSKHCRRVECNLGNLVADAIIDWNAREYIKNDGWTDAAIALQNGGAIRSSIKKEQGEKITMGDVLSVLPFNSNVLKMTITGSKIVEVLEWSVRTLKPNDTSDLNGAFLQFSGLQVIYDLSKPPGSRVHSAMARCANCRVPNFSEIRRNSTYAVLTTDFMQGGGDGYTMLMNDNYTSCGITTDAVLVDYLKSKSPVHPGVEWRIRYLVKANGTEIITSEPAKSIDLQGYFEGHIGTNENEKSSSTCYRPVLIILILSLISSKVT